MSLRACLLALAALVAAPAAARADDGELARGELIFHIGGCTNCHTAKNGALLAGGDAIASPYGNFYAPNITPDPETGIGGWTQAQFDQAMREGRDPDGWPLYPAFPYMSYTHLTDEDLAALKTYLDTLPPVSQASKPQDLTFPFSLRWGLYLWQWLFFEPARLQPDPAKDAAWNRGAYLVLGPGHCAECHTPRTFYGVLEQDHAFAGSQLGKEKVPNLTSDPAKGIGKWSADDLKTFFTLGMMPDGDFVGSEMAKVVNNGTSKLPDGDVAAIVAYLQSLPPR
ncbi:MAG: c-type cytochrome [Geminicoccaceae bacterium]